LTMSTLERMSSVSSRSVDIGLPRSPPGGRPHFGAE
jgi:hypothetical protein